MTAAVSREVPRETPCKVQWEGIGSFEESAERKGTMGRHRPARASRNIFTDYSRCFGFMAVGLADFSSVQVGD